MNRLTLLSLMAAVPLVAGAADTAPAWLVEPSLQTRVGFDTNPQGNSGTSAVVLGDEDTLTYTVGTSFGVLLSDATPDRPSLKFTYAVEAVRFDRWSSEDYTTHRFGWASKFAAGAWTFTGEGSSLLVAGSRDTVPSLTTLNGNAISIWRERRRQWQDRVKLQAQVDLGALIVRGTGTLLDYDYQTHLVAGKIAFADRSDAQGAFDLGWKQTANSLWLAGMRAGHQSQGTIPLPNCAFDYSSDYYRLAAGWEGKPLAGTTVTFAAGPDFRHYTGVVDTRVFLYGRDRTSLWFDGGFASKLSPALTLTGKAGRTVWLSSTGKSAYLDSSVETALAWTVTRAWTMRATAKVHRCDYLPTVRDDWESMYGAGATLKYSDRTTFTFDALRHRGWNSVSGMPERTFQRLILNVGAGIRL